MSDKHSGGVRRIFAEDVPAETLVQRPVIRALASRGLEVVLSVRPNDVYPTLSAYRRLRGEGLHVALWPMLANADGRWANLTNQDAFCGFTRQLLDRPEVRDLETVVIDVEPPIAWMRDVLRGRLRRVQAERKDEPASSLVELLTALRARRVQTLLAATPFVLLPDARAREGWHRMLHIPDLSSHVDGIDVMLYSSLLQGYGRGLLRRDDALALLSYGAARASDRFEERAGVALGTVGPGALGDERPYASPEELARDVAVACCEGIANLSLFDLGGALQRPPLEAWLDAFVTPPSTQERPVVTRRARALQLAASLLGKASSRGGPRSV